VAREPIVPKPPAAATDPMLPALSADPMDPADPMDAMDPADPSENTDPTAFTEPMLKALLDEAMQANESCDHTDQREVLRGVCSMLIGGSSRGR